MHDANMFPGPDNLCPERFLETADPRLQTFDLPFGWGKRICPGMYVFKFALHRCFPYPLGVRYACYRRSTARSLLAVADLSNC
ncbi:uncharacterized protein EDB91DRAFT_1139860 [Suillus paluster]|uniref:uncharacterized protein n=1 Tax=Suillus paluster TaxID=48578 RepID=UPI001B861AA9|nr:uncharacterized protein EDB91DRAFT_1139860 [Suillus paluster]KAG1737462.1 hypothetical protein EDB91DRAFT_1139860 [Suillus paluster]